MENIKITFSIFAIGKKWEAVLYKRICTDQLFFQNGLLLTPKASYYPLQFQTEAFNSTYMYPVNSTLGTCKMLIGQDVPGENTVSSYTYTVFARCDALSETTIVAAMLTLTLFHQSRIKNALSI